MFTTPCFIGKYFRTSQEVRGIGYYLHPSEKKLYEQ